MHRIHFIALSSLEVAKGLQGDHCYLICKECLLFKEQSISKLCFNK